MKNLETYNPFQTPEKPETDSNKPGNNESADNEKVENKKAGNKPNEVMVIGHCLLNPLARLKGGKPALPVDTRGANIIQLPCPEAMYFGMLRREVTKDQLDHPAYRRFCQNLFSPFADLLEDLSATGINIKIIGVPKSPSCGVEITSVGGEPGKVKEFHHSHAPGPGVFMEEIIKELKKRNVKFEIKDVGKEE